jgi:hypothetical protein
LEKAEGFKGNQHQVVPIDGKKQTKEQQLKEAGISKSTANRYEELVGPTVQIGMQAADEYFVNAAATNEPVTMKGYRKAVSKSVSAANRELMFLNVGRITNRSASKGCLSA